MTHTSTTARKHFRDDSESTGNENKTSINHDRSEFSAIQLRISTTAPDSR